MATLYLLNTSILIAAMKGQASVRQPLKLGSSPTPALVQTPTIGANTNW
ncbi:MAG: hypothetical protein FWG56_07445 [Desulfovibrionaceae bacterium]|nr:hypothetical protein [Desulfovibrionaceae bacterium]